MLSLSKTLYLLLGTGSTHEDWESSQHDFKSVDWDIKHKKNPKNPYRVDFAKISLTLKIQNEN